jgi:hypothetical protein
MKFLQLVSCCNECLHKSYYSGGRSECTKTRTILPFNEGHTIPEWCPLPDYPSDAMAKQAEEAKDAGEREVKAWAERDQYMQSNMKLVAEVQQLREALAGDQQRLFHYEGEAHRLRSLIVTVKGNCGITHPSIEDWQKCETCRAIGASNRATR